MSNENNFPARTFGFEFLKDHVREYAELIDRTLNMNIPTISEFDNNLSEWQTLEGKLKGFSSAMKHLKRNFHEGHELIGILDDIFVYAVPIKGIARTKEKVYTEIFGNKKGYSTVDNEVKIISHGFDPKESFRKIKKKKK